jgi:hypothetical protein
LDIKNDIPKASDNREVKADEYEDGFVNLIVLDMEYGIKAIHN